jgi:ubiquinone/menaquinone biosynthesis C-methylase UbiE
VGPTGLVIGADHDPEMVGEADRRAATAGVADRVEHRVGDALALPLPDPGRALAEMVRVTRAGGRIVGFDTDWGRRRSTATRSTSSGASCASGRTAASGAAMRGGCSTGCSGSAA